MAKLEDFRVSNGLGPKETDTYIDGPSMTRQEFADECNINSIMERYDAYLSDPMRSIREPRYYDFTEMPDTLMGFMEKMHEAETAFMTLPAVVRREFDNDPVQFCDFAADPTNLDMMREWGLAPPAKAPEPPNGNREAPPSGSSSSASAGSAASTPSST